MCVEYRFTIRSNASSRLEFEDPVLKRLVIIAEHDVAREASTLKTADLLVKLWIAWMPWRFR